MNFHEQHKKICIRRNPSDCRRHRSFVVVVISFFRCPPFPSSDTSQRVDGFYFRSLPSALQRRLTVKNCFSSSSSAPALLRIFHELKNFLSFHTWSFLGWGQLRNCTMYWLFQLIREIFHKTSIRLQFFLIGFSVFVFVICSILFFWISLETCNWTSPRATDEWNVRSDYDSIWFSLSRDFSRSHRSTSVDQGCLDNTQHAAPTNSSILIQRRLHSTIKSRWIARNDKIDLMESCSRWLNNIRLEFWT